MVRTLAIIVLTLCATVHAQSGEVDDDKVSGDDDLVGDDCAYAYDDCRLLGICCDTTYTCYTKASGVGFE